MKWDFYYEIKESNGIFVGWGIKGECDKNIRR